MPKHQRNELLAGVVGLIVVAGVVLYAPKIGFSYAILAAVLAWLGGCVLYAGSYHDDNPVF